MTNQERITYTKKCLELLGYRCVTPDDKDFRIYEGNNPVIPKMVDANFDDAFLKDWNNIQEIIDTIEKLGFNVIITRSCITIEPSFDSEYDFKSIHKFHSMNGEFETKKEAVVEAINEYFSYYTILPSDSGI